MTRRSGHLPGNAPAQSANHPKPPFEGRVRAEQAHQTRTAQLLRAATLIGQPPNPKHVGDLGGLWIRELKCSDCPMRWVALSRVPVRVSDAIPACPVCRSSGLEFEPPYEGIAEVNAQAGILRWRRVVDGVGVAPWNYVPWDSATLHTLSAEPATE